ncbi:MAG: DmsC/YnfH family molybdoenzyme membrane anchor subunit [Paracoccaceae bacterium]
MHPAPSVILFTVLSGLGFGYLAYLGLGLATPTGWLAFFHYGLGYALAVGGLMASTFHLGNPQRALRAFTQWRTSWLSREAWASVAALTLLAPAALSAWLGLNPPPLFGVIGAGLCLVTIGCTSMIYAQLATIPRWNHWSTPALFMAFALTGGAILAGQGIAAMLLGLGLMALLATSFQLGDQQFAKRGATLGTATGLGAIGTPRVFAQPHTADNYLLREMIHVVARKHSRKLRRIALITAASLPALILINPLLPWPLLIAALIVHLACAFTARWLFFAEAEHVVGLYYGMR